MPTTKVGDDAWLIPLLLSVYDARTWADDCSLKIRMDTVIDGGIDMLATRLSDGRTLAIEHTMIEPFVGEKDDFYKHCEGLQGALRADKSLLVPGFLVHINLPVRVVPHKKYLQGIIDDVSRWPPTKPFVSGGYVPTAVSLSKPSGRRAND